ncbi:hypothetical protein BE221DRAFT_188742 [Ostreococcus tauri]|uniref:Uncharacterized protein n=1 Tax=Ostreococcus tauri TaxID=70448 RepID=A0A1Y5IIR7_OSTTA|nr:hypothetical protein BE221DRAFT_188742 [Ostreococcus tauri]
MTSRERALVARLPEPLRSMSVSDVARVAVEAYGLGAGEGTWTTGRWMGDGATDADDALERLCARASTCARCGRVVLEEAMAAHAKRGCGRVERKDAGGGKRGRGDDARGTKASARAASTREGEERTRERRARGDEGARECAWAVAPMVSGKEKDTKRVRWALTIGAMFRAKAFESPRDAFR